MFEIPRRPLGRTIAPVAAPIAKRRFEAAQINRLTQSWMTGTAAIDAELRSDLDALRVRARDLVKNNAYARKFVRSVRTNVAGTEGFTLQLRVTDPNGRPDSGANRAIERAWYRYSRPGNCDVTRRLSLPDFERLICEVLATDGEVLLREVRGRDRGEFGLQWELIDVDRLDTSYNVPHVNGRNAIVMGVEVDTYGAPVAYHLWSGHPTSYGGRKERQRVPASEIIHAFIPLFAGQTRGIPWMHAAMKMLHDLGGYREAAVIAARVGAAKMGIWETPEGEPPPGAEAGDTPTEHVTDATPGHFDFAPAGYKLHTYDPAYPHDQFDAFCKAALRGVAGGIGMAYNSLANDLEGVNYSSIRAGVLEERDEWMVIQNWMTSTILTPMYERWLELSLAMGMIKLDNGSPLPLAKIEKFREHGFQGRRWSWVDPKKDIEAAIMAIDAKLTSPQAVAAQSGRDIEDVLDDLAAFQSMLKEKKLVTPPKGDKNTPAETATE